MLLLTHGAAFYSWASQVCVATSPWVTFFGCGLDPEHPSARPLAWVPPRNARLCVRVTAVATEVSGPFANWKFKLSFVPCFQPRCGKVYWGDAGGTPAQILRQPEGSGVG